MCKARVFASLLKTRPVWTGFKIAVRHKLLTRIRLDYILLLKKEIVNSIALL